MDELDISTEGGSEGFYDNSDEIRTDEVSEHDSEILEDGFSHLDEEQRVIEVLSDDEINEIQQELTVEQNSLFLSDDNDDFAKRIDSMSLDELWDEREKLIELGALDREQSAADEQSVRQADSIIEGLSKEQLETLRSKLESNDPEIMAILGLNDESGDDTGPQLVLRKK